MTRHAVLSLSRRQVMIVDDHPLVREGLTKIIDQQPDLQVCGTAATPAQCLAAIATLQPDVVIVDLSLEQGSGMVLIKDLVRQFPRVPVLTLSMHHEDLYAERVLRAGARGYVMKNQPADAIIAALRKVLRGLTAVSDNVVDRIVRNGGRGRLHHSALPDDILSDRELEIFQLLGKGHRTRDIATLLHLTVSTVESHRAAIKRKLQIDNATELIACATRFMTQSPADG